MGFRGVTTSPPGSPPLDYAFRLRAVFGRLSPIRYAHHVVWRLEVRHSQPPSASRPWLAWLHQILHCRALFLGLSTRCATRLSWSAPRPAAAPSNFTARCNLTQNLRCLNLHEALSRPETRLTRLTRCESSNPTTPFQVGVSRGCTPYRVGGEDGCGVSGILSSL